MNFLPVRIGTLRPNAAINFEIFILVAGKHILYIGNADVFDEERLVKLRSKGVKKLYIPSVSEANYLAYLDSGLTSLVSTSAPMSEKSAIAVDSMATEAENIQHHLDNEQSYHATENRLGKMVGFLLSDKTALSSVLKTSGCSTDDQHHSSSVAFLSLGLALRVGGLSSKDLFDLSVAALVHDIGKEKPGTSLQAHPRAAVDMLAEKRFISPAVLRLVLEHEEIGEAEGYPERKRIEKMTLTSQILNLCNHFDRVSMTKGIGHTELIRIYFQEYAHLFNLEHINHLSAVLASK